ncbi:putative Fe superoxide dismutase [Cladophialophora carrionii]|uniref:Putative Fe superoxide dismutase n=1 Tax=Cladophialophora carrionii TaxID=86049 RepID=A0A1C1CE97_9EURO|nr:putative Fe superoxide dismutase [Cladophialophora carrionii]
MITRPVTRPQSLLRALVKQTQPRHTSASFTLTPFQRRCKHGVPIWPNQARQELFARHGVPGFLSAETYQETYVRYSQHLADQLNELTLGTVDEDTGTHALHVKYAHRSDKAYLYNISAMLTFTRFFWEECLTETKDPAARKPGLLTMKSIEHTFGNVETLREEMLETADAMFGNGFVWLMKGESGQDLKILRTYNAGSPYPEAAPRRDDTDMATFGPGSSISDQLSGRSGLGLSGPEERDIAVGSSTAGSFGDFSANRNRYHAGLLPMQPILCVNVWEHQWMRDYGLLGKRQYLTAWWDRIDWQKVENAHNLITTENLSSWQRKQPAYSAHRYESAMDIFPR